VTRKVVKRRKNCTSRQLGFVTGFTNIFEPFASSAGWVWIHWRRADAKGPTSAPSSMTASSIDRAAADSPCCPRYPGYQDWCRHRRTEGPDLMLITGVALVGSGVIVAILGSVRKQA
jgi:hypothetical protein